MQTDPAPVQLSPHFALDEFRCHDGTPYPIDQIDDEDPAGRTWRESRLMVLVSTLEIIRAAAGCAIRIDSGYRTIAYDDRLYRHSAKDGSVAPAARSQHPKGRAADIACGALSAAELHALILRLYETGKLPNLGGLGIYPNFVHVDVRPNTGHLARWVGGRRSNVA